MDFLHVILHYIVDFSILCFDFIGVGIIIATGISGLYSYIRRDPATKLNLAKGLAMGLEFKLGGEILKTVIVSNFSEILVVAGIILLRSSLSLLIHWEIKNEECNHIQLDDEPHKEPDSAKKIKIEEVLTIKKTQNPQEETTNEENNKRGKRTQNNSLGRHWKHYKREALVYKASLFLFFFLLQFFCFFLFFSSFILFLSIAFLILHKAYYRSTHTPPCYF